MITFKEFGRYGRLGNMMFQYATLYGCAKKIRYEAALPLQPSAYYPREWLWPYKGSIRVGEKVPFYQTYSEPNFSFSPNLWSIADRTNLHGYFQSEKYFDFCRDEILKEFSLSETRVAHFDPAPSHTIAIHIRRGDFLNHPTTHPAIPLGWYAEMIKKYETTKNAPVYLFTDDPNDRSLREGLNILGVKNITPIKALDHVEIAIMASCRTVIMANSSFSWWGGWLNNRPDRQIIAPYPWFGPSGPQEFEDIYAKGWHVENWQ